MIDDTYSINEDSDDNELGGERGDMQDFFSGNDVDYIYVELVRKGDNGSVFLRVLGSPYGFLNKHTTGDRIEKNRILHLSTRAFHKIFPSENNKEIMRGHCDELIKLYELSRQDLVERIRSSRIENYEDSMDILYCANEEDDED